jgi:uncharacterized membrane protein YidH (DUF202 family)
LSPREGSEATIETALGILAAGLGLAGVAIFFLTRAPTVRMVSLGLVLLAGALGWVAWSDLTPAER